MKADARGTRRWSRRVWQVADHAFDRQAQLAKVKPRAELLIYAG
jgi:hypothetical protein